MTPRGALKRDRPLVVVLGELVEFLVLNDLEIPEAERERGKDDGDAHLEDHQPNGDLSSILNLRPEA